MRWVCPFRYKLFGDEQHPLLFDGQIFDWDSQLQVALEESPEQLLAHSLWDSFLSVGITDGVDFSGSGRMGSVSELQSRGLDDCLGPLRPTPNETEESAGIPSITMR